MVTPVPVITDAPRELSRKNGPEAIMNYPQITQITQIKKKNDDRGQFALATEKSPALLSDFSICVICVICG
jgi:hypothetical protein